MRDAVARHRAVPREDVEVVGLGLAATPTCGDEASYVAEVAVADPDRVWLRGVQRGAECLRVRLDPVVRVHVEVPVAAAAALRGQPVAVAFQRVDARRVDGIPIATTSRAYEARVDLAAGEPLTDRVVRPVPDGRRDATVVVVASRGGLHIEAQGRLLRDASLGDVVEVANLATGVVVQGVLVAPGRVELR